MLSGLSVLVEAIIFAEYAKINNDQKHEIQFSTPNYGMRNDIPERSECGYTSYGMWGSVSETKLQKNQQLALLYGMRKGKEIGFVD